MPNKTTKLGLNTFLENEVVDFELVNENFEKIDKLVVCTESGTKTASYTGGVSGTTTWRYKKFSDNTIEMSTKMEFTNIKCNGGTASPYYSGISTVYFPFELTSVYNVQMHLASNTFGWVTNITGASVIDNVKFRILNPSKEETAVYKQVFITVKGVM